MKLTDHAKTRAQQRGIPILALDLIKKFGRYEKALGGATKIFLEKKEVHRIRQDCKKIIQSLDKLSGVSMIIESDSILTIYKQER